MALVDGGVGGEEVEIVATFGIPDGGSLGAGKDDGEWVVVVSGIVVLGGDSGVCGGDMVLRGAPGGLE